MIYQLIRNLKKKSIKRKLIILKDFELIILTNLNSDNLPEKLSISETIKIKNTDHKNNSVKTADNLTNSLKKIKTSELEKKTNHDIHYIKYIKQGINTCWFDCFLSIFHLIYNESKESFNMPQNRNNKFILNIFELLNLKQYEEAQTRFIDYCYKYKITMEKSFSIGSINYLIGKFWNTSIKDFTMTFTNHIYCENEKCKVYIDKSPKHKEVQAPYIYSINEIRNSYNTLIENMIHLNFVETNTKELCQILKF